ncbi:MAG: sugar phosphate nucleotidyltransferase [Eubacteriales bacterium]
MNFEYIIVQAGGLGSRLEHLTKNRSKAMVPVNNAPILFHLFRKYPKKKFIIIGDYKFEEFSNYLSCFAPVDYILIQSIEKGNVSGLDQSLGYLPEQSPFMIIWSDLILSEDFETDSLKNGCYVGVSDRFTCSWSFSDGVLEKKSTTQTGVAGCFLFDCKTKLQNLPKGGSFTKYLKQSDLDLQHFSMESTKEVGSLEGISELEKDYQHRCRPYNSIEMGETQVVKRGLTPEANTLIDREIVWFDAVKKCGFTGIPQVISLDPLTTERIYGENLFLTPLSDPEKKETITRLCEKLDNLHHLQTGEVNYFDLQKEYEQKTLDRLVGIAPSIPFHHQKEIKINGKLCRNILMDRTYFRHLIDRIMVPSEFGLLHGDCTFTNSLINGDGDIFFIDPRGYFGNTPLIGDVYYDWAKIYYSIVGRFDQFNVKRFSLEIGENEVNFSINPSGWEGFTDYFLSLIPNCNLYRLKLIHGIVWLSLASHCWEDFDSMCLAYYHGLYLLHGLEEEK